VADGSTPAEPPAVGRSPRSPIGAFWASAVGKKAVMGATGVVLVGYLVVHMAGNLQVFLGREVFNRYAALLHTSEELLWLIRVVLFTCAVLHVIAAYQLTMLAGAARPVGYAKREYRAATLASRLMRAGGVLILVFIPLHVLNFTTGGWHPAFAHGDVYGNVIYAFESWPLLSVFYGVTMVFVGLHLYHGVWAMFRSLGVAKPSPTPLQRTLASVVAWVVAVGFILVPTAILLGLVR
jgi:succinate dehydrogenase / fumarate reductase cytochrome b subunit